MESPVTPPTNPSKPDDQPAALPSAGQIIYSHDADVPPRAAPTPAAPGASDTPRPMNPGFIAPSMGPDTRSGTPPGVPPESPHHYDPINIIHNEPRHAANHHRGPIVGGIFLALLLIIGCAVYLYPKAPSEADAASLPPAQVRITADGFSPATVKLKKGQQLTWTNTDSTPHQAMSAGSSSGLPSNNGVLGQNESLTITLEQPGVYQYHDALSTTDFRGTIIVE
jgi:plastocyanin